MANHMISHPRAITEARNTLNHLAARFQTEDAKPDVGVLLQALEQARVLLPGELYMPITNLLDGYVQAEHRQKVPVA